MAKIIWVKSQVESQAPKENFLQKFLDWFRSLDKFTQYQLLFAACFILIASSLGVGYITFFSHASGTTLSMVIDYNAPTTTFNKNILGQAYVNLAIGRIGNNMFDAALVPGLIQATQAIDPGIIRVGGVWANEVGWTRTPGCLQYCDWTAPGSTMTYYFKYYPALIDKLVQETAQMGATKLILTTNVSDGNPGMWADLVNYVKSQKAVNAPYYNTVTIYYELGNELDLNNTNNYATAPSLSLPHLLGQTYVKQFNAYQQAMLAADPNAKIIGPTISNSQEITWSGTGHGLSSNMSPFFSYLATQSAAPISLMTTHWYATCNLTVTATNIPSILNWQTYAGIDLMTSPYNEGSRHYADILGNRIRNEDLRNSPSANAEIGITEQNIDGCVSSSNPSGSAFNGDFIGALYFADVLPRMAYNGINYATRYEGYGTDNLSLIYPNNSTTPTGVYLRPPYIAYLLYSQLFDPNMLPVTPLNDPTATDYSDKNAFSVWASKDAKSSELTLIATNMTNAPIQATTTITNFPSSQMSGSYYEILSSTTTPTTMDLTSSQATDMASVTINNVHLDPMNILGSLAAIAPLPIPTSEMANTSNTLIHTYPPYSITRIKLTGTNAMPPTTTPTPTTTITSVTPPQPTPTVLPSPTPTITQPITDTIPPTVSITSPATGAIVSKHSTVILTASATDNVAVGQVIFYVNGQSICTDLTGPYTCSWSLPGKPGAQYTLTAKAVDTAGNSQLSSPVIVTTQ